MRNTLAPFMLALAAATPCLAQQFSNTSPITILPNGAASPYPTSIAVAGVTPGSFNSIEVQVVGLSHTSLPDIDMLLVGPQGQSVMLLSDAGGTCPVSDLTLTFRDDFTAAPSGCGIVSVHAPTNYGAGDPMPSPAPAGPYGTSMAGLLAGNVNGAWSLYVNDDTISNGGSISGGWSIRFLPESHNSPTKMTYQGRLDSNNAPVNGTADLTFSLYNRVIGGVLVSPVVQRPSTPITNGLFTTDLDFGAGFHIVGDLWLEVQVNGTTLAPRQPFTAAPRAISATSARQLADISGNPTMTASGANVGIGTTTPTTSLHISRPSPTLALQDSSSNANQQTGFITFRDNTNTETGWMGFGSTANADLSVVNARLNGDLLLQAVNGGEVIVPSSSMYIRTPNPVLVLQDTDASIDQNGFLSFHNSSDVETAWFGFGTPGSPEMSIVNARSAGNMTLSTITTGDINLMPGASGSVGINTSTPALPFKLDVGGAIRCTTLTQTSSAIYKDAVTPMTQGLDDLLKLAPVTYTWNDKAPDQIRGKHDLGLIAEEVEKVLPDAVACDEAGKPVGIDYSRITVLAVQAIKEQQARADEATRELRARLDRLEALLAAQQK